MMPTERVEEILDRLAEMEHALPGLRGRSPATADYVIRELLLLLTECSEKRDRCQGALDRTRNLAAESGEPLDATSAPPE